jgi:hypothetical protein
VLSGPGHFGKGVGYPDVAGKSALPRDAPVQDAIVGEWIAGDVANGSDDDVGVEVALAEDAGCRRRGRPGRGEAGDPIRGKPLDPNATPSGSKSDAT